MKVTITLTSGQAAALGRDLELRHGAAAPTVEAFLQVVVSQLADQTMQAQLQQLGAELVRLDPELLASMQEKAFARLREIEHAARGVGDEKPGRRAADARPGGPPV